MRVIAALVVVALCLTTAVQCKRYFAYNAPWFTDISAKTPDPNSANIISFLSTNGAFGGSGTGGLMKIDLSMYILHANSSTPRFPIEQVAYFTPDCDALPGGFPLPTGGRIEDETGYSCTGGGDCHILVVETSQRMIYESYASNLSGGKLQSQCALAWDACGNYPANLRGDQCTSTDAAGFPVTQLLFTADEIASGTIDHAIRFILPNTEMRKSSYVHPATHAGGPSSTNTNAPVYGMRMRLKSSFNVTTLKPAARVIARALQKYGMFLADGGRIALTGANDFFSTAKYATLGLGTNDLNALTPSQFEVMPLGTVVALTDDCVRNTIPKLSSCNITLT